MNTMFLLLSIIPGLAYIVCSLIGWGMIIRNMYDDDLRNEFKKLDAAHQRKMKEEKYIVDGIQYEMGISKV